MQLGLAGKGVPQTIPVVMQELFKKPPDYITLQWRNDVTRYLVTVTNFRFLSDLFRIQSK